MKIAFLLMTLLMTTQAFADGCALYELSGTVRNIKNDLHLLVAEKTGSELDLRIPIMIQTEFSPYVNKFATGKFIVEGKTIQTRKNILSVEKIDFGVYDPMNQNERSAFKKIKEVVCPKL